MSTAFVRKLVRAQQFPVIGRIATEMLGVYGVEIPKQVRIGEGFYLAHRGLGVVVTPHTTIGRNVRIYQGVTIGRADIHVSFEESEFSGVEVEDDAMLCAGSVVLGGKGVTTVGRGTIVGANAVLTQSTGEWEVWAGQPARKVADRPRPTP